MPKLLRVVQASPLPAGAQASFEVALADGIQLDPYARVGLKNIVVPLTTSGQIIIDVNSNQFTLRPSGVNGVATALITIMAPGATSETFTVDTFLARLNERIVEAMTFVGGAAVNARVWLGMLFRFELQPANTRMAQFRYTRSALEASMVAGNTDMSANVVFAAGPPAVFTVAAGAGALGEEWAFGRAYLTRGCSYARAEFGGAASRTRLAICSAVDSATNLPGPGGNVDFYMYADVGGTGNYVYWDPAADAEVDSGQAAVAANVLEISVQNRRIRYASYADNTANDPEWSFTLPAGVASSYFDLKLNYRPGLVFQRDAGGPVSMGAPVFVKDPDYVLDPETDNILEILALPSVPRIVEPPMHSLLGFEGIGEPPINAPPIPPNPAGAIAPKLTFPANSAALRSILGFADSVLTPPGTASAYIFPALNPIDAIILAKGIFVEVPSLPSLQGWDTSTGRRRPILAVIPDIVTGLSNIVEFSEPHPPMLDIGNAQPMLLRNLFLRIFVNTVDGEKLAQLDAPVLATLIFDDTPQGLSR